MPSFVDSREAVHAALARELLGPTKQGERRGRPLDLGQPVRFASWQDAAGPWHDSDTGEEVLNGIDPVKRYGVAILHPVRVQEADATSEVPALNLTELDEPPADAPEPPRPGRVAADGDDLDLSLANSYAQSTVGVTFNADLPPGGQLLVVARAARYSPFTASVDDREQTWWVRRPVTVTAAFRASDLAGGMARQRVLPHQVEVEGDEGASVEIAAYSRRVHGEQLVTVTMTNRAGSRGSGNCLFQAGFDVLARDGAAIIPYPERRAETEGLEEQSIELLYRDHQTFGIGHGCAADWEREPGSRVDALVATCLPSFEVPSVTPDIRRVDGSALQVDMRVLADAGRAAEGHRQLQDLLDGYAAWIDARRQDVGALEERHRSAGARHLELCSQAHGRMVTGLRLIQDDLAAAAAFRLANEAMLSQQARSSTPMRPTAVEEGVVRVSGTVPDGTLGADRGYWRPFQIAFLLAALESVDNRGSEDREIIELIFFPTGGGKTEAYLALAAFAMLRRRQRAVEAGEPQAGTEVLMRYTLRLLTAQQFLRAAALTCALEQIRLGQAPAASGGQDLGEEPFTIGIWLGGDTTPNKQDAAVKAWDELARDPSGSKNMFLLLRCPWCAAQMGPTEGQQKQRRQRGRSRAPAVIPGYRRGRDRVDLACPDARCPFHRALPVYVVDDDIYRKRPTVVIGTVDKFAMLPWRPESRALFGLAEDGTRDREPPGLIIQDEFHLISGPLGSMVGMYEGVIEDLCTDRRTVPATRPKIVASTATIRRYEEQCLAIYSRERVSLFPPQGLTASDSYFAVWARDSDGKLQPGRRYVGVHAPALGSMQSVQVRVGASLLQAPSELPEGQRDPWWTNLWFFNSLRELGNTLSLMQADIPDYLVAMQRRDGIQPRYPGTPLELTSRRRDDEIPRAIEQLQRTFDSGDAVPVCLASNIIEVGVDIDRLSLMTVVGQPKTTAQYIQVSGRVGRRWWERPGLVVTIYGAAKPRDRSHFERFRSYHERLYAQVEPTSVTPFARPVLERAARGALVAHVRLTAPLDPELPAWPYPGERVEAAAELLLARAGDVDPAELDSLREVLQEAEGEWRTWARAKWDANPRGGDPHNGLMRYSGTAAVEAPSWQVPSSMRSVDAECRARVTTAFYDTLHEESE